MKAHVIKTEVLGALNDRLPSGDIGRWVTRQGENAAFQCATKLDRLIIQDEPCSVRRQLPHPECCLRCMFGVAGQLHLQRVQMRVVLVPEFRLRSEGKINVGFQRFASHGYVLVCGLRRRVGAGRTGTEFHLAQECPCDSES